MADEILVKQDGAVLNITINAPDRGNAVTDDMVKTLTRTINEASKTADIVVLRGAGKDFCIGRAGMGIGNRLLQRTSHRRRGTGNAEKDQRRVECLGSEHRIQRLFHDVMVGGDQPGHVDRIGRRAMRHQRFQRGLGFRRNRAHLQVRVADEIGDLHPDSAGDADHADARPLG